MTQIISFVAYSGTGKTTFIEKLIPELTARGLKIAVIKHDAHDFDIDKQGKDSWRFTNAGAVITAVVSTSHSAVMFNTPRDFEDIIADIAGRRGIDLILTEGYKTGGYPKIALRREATGKDFPVAAESCIALISDTHIECGKPVFGFNDAPRLADWLKEHYYDTGE